MKFNILDSFDIFLREPLSIFKNGLQIVGINIFAQKSAINVDFINNKHQITVVNNEKVYNLLKTVTYKKQLMDKNKDGTTKIECKVHN